MFSTVHLGIMIFVIKQRIKYIPQDLCNIVISKGHWLSETLHGPRPRDIQQTLLNQQTLTSPLSSSIKRPCDSNMVCYT